MNSKEYKLPNGKVAVFEYDIFGIGKITLECMDELMGMIADRPQWWIPCSERMPEGSDGISECEMVLMTLSVGDVACGWINGDTAYVLINTPVYDQIVIADKKDVLAWMPMPEPWKGADDE